LPSILSIKPTKKAVFLCQSLLKIGNIEAVVAVANSQNLNDEVLDLVWWCATNTDQQAEIGRFLLTRDFVAKHSVGQQIAHYLLEFLSPTALRYFLLEFGTAQCLRVFEPLDVTGKHLILLRCDIKHVY
jgi:hypothetical protein